MRLFTPKIYPLSIRRLIKSGSQTIQNNGTKCTDLCGLQKFCIPNSSFSCELDFGQITNRINQ